MSAQAWPRRGALNWSWAGSAIGKLVRRAQVRSLLADRQAWQEWQQRLGPAPAPSFALLPAVPSFAQLPSAEAAAAAAAPAPAARDAADKPDGAAAANSDGVGGAQPAAGDSAAAAAGGSDLDGLLRCAARRMPSQRGLLHGSGRNTVRHSCVWGHANAEVGLDLVEDML